MTKTNLEVTNEKLEAELEETKQQLRAALSGPITERGDSKTSKASVVTRSAIRFYAFAIILSVCQFQEQLDGNSLQFTFSGKRGCTD